MPPIQMTDWIGVFVDEMKIRCLGGWNYGRWVDRLLMYKWLVGSMDIIMALRINVCMADLVVRWTDFAWMDDWLDRYLCEWMDDKMFGWLKGWRMSLKIVGVWLFGWINGRKIIDNVFRKSWELLPYAIMTLTEFLDKRQIFEPKSWKHFCFIHFFLLKTKKLTRFTVSFEQFETSIINL